MKRLFSCLFLFSQTLFAHLVVHVPTDEHLEPLYLQVTGTPYAKRVETVLGFDLDNNGQTRLDHRPAAAKQAKKEGSKYDLELWRRLGTSFVVKAHVTPDLLTLTAFRSSDGSVSGLRIPLKGNLQEDRDAIHGVSDAIHEAFFGTPGIAKSRILYTLRHRHAHSSDEWVTEVWESDYDGHNARQITREGNLCVTPVYFPSKGGKSLYFFYVSYCTGQPKLKVASLAEGAGKRLSYLKGNQLMPAIAPSGDQVAFVSDALGNPDLFVQSFHPENGLEGRASLAFSAPRATQGSPAYSPDGKHLAFVSNKDGRPRIYTMEVGSQKAPRLISRRSKECTSPAWSPDGTKLAFSAMTHGTRQIWIFDFNRNEEWQLTDGAGHKENPSWAPNSCHLVCNAVQGNQSELFLLSLRKKEAIQISRGRGEKRFPAWEPLSS